MRGVRIFAELMATTEGRRTGASGLAARCLPTAAIVDGGRAEELRRNEVHVLPVKHRRRAGDRRRLQSGLIRRWPEVGCSAVTDDERDAVPIEEILDRIPGAPERAEEGLDQARRGAGIPLDALVDPAPRAPDAPA
jgi:hypothetical protein